MSDHNPSDERVSNKLVSGKLSLEQAKAKAEEAASVLQARFPGSYSQWIDSKVLRVFQEDDTPIATIHLESLQ